MPSSRFDMTSEEKVVSTTDGVRIARKGTFRCGRGGFGRAGAHCFKDAQSGNALELAELVR